TPKTTLRMGAREGVYLTHKAQEDRLSPSGLGVLTRRRHRAARRRGREASPVRRRAGRRTIAPAKFERTTGLLVRPSAEECGRVATVPFFLRRKAFWDSRLLLALCKSISTGAGHS